MNNRWHAHTHAHAHIRPEKAFTQNSILIMRSIPKKNWTSGWERRRRMKRWSEEETMKTDLHMILSIRHKFCCVYFCCFCCTEVYRGVQLCVTHHIMFSHHKRFPAGPELYTVCDAGNLFIFLLFRLLSGRKAGKEKKRNKNAMDWE